jgi:hypothetical protein
MKQVHYGKVSPELIEGVTIKNYKTVETTILDN